VIIKIDKKTELSAPEPSRHLSISEMLIRIEELETMVCAVANSLNAEFGPYPWYATLDRIESVAFAELWIRKFLETAPG
jgi:hypothetical protein